MHPDLERAIELQRLDKEIARLTAEIAELPRHLHEIERKLAGAQKQFEADKAALAANQQDRKKLDQEIPPLQQKISKYKGQMFDVKTNDEYKALQHEIAYAEGEVRAIEDKILERMLLSEELEKKVKQAEKQLAAERAEVEKEKAEVTARTKKDQAELAEFRKQRDGFAKKVSASTLRAYEAIGKRRGTAVAEFRADGTCSECHVRLRPQAFQEIKPNDAVRFCENCGRIAVFLVERSAGSPEPPPRGERLYVQTLPTGSFSDDLQSLLHEFMNRAAEAGLRLEHKRGSVSLIRADKTVFKGFLSNSSTPSLEELGTGLILGPSSSIPVDRERFRELEFDPREILVMQQPYYCFRVASPEELARKWPVIRSLLAEVANAAAEHQLTESSGG